MLRDGSALVEVTLEDKSRRRQYLKHLHPREIQVEVWHQDQNKKSELRLWTTLLDENKYPAPELAQLYAQRWKAELFFHQLKAHTHCDNLMRSGSIEGAQAEFEALIMAASLLTAQRLSLAKA